ncbi:MAG: hypothetical protein IT306_02315 [Chloroflexi bacterium]|nr:hypothetical protein [Chloroflexota bacterium]
MATSSLDRSTRRERRGRRSAAPAVPTWTLDRVMLGAAAIGVLVSAYLLLVDLAGGSTLCLPGTDCDVVRASAYGKVFGLPMALLGVGYFLSVALVALLRAPWQLRALRLLGGVGLGAAILFVGLQGLVLNTWCPYCVVADVAALTIGVRTLWPWGSPAQVWQGGRLAPALLGATLAVAVLLLGYAAGPAAAPAAASIASNPETDELTALADHLTASGAVFYGAYWCPHCQNQKKMFGDAADRLPYVECDARGKNARPAACTAAGVRAYPTWVINGQKIEGEIPVRELARLSGFQQ